ncbi:acid phosphatase [Skermania piniformis]|nr:acid phosphatase [Skermania piniformis]
MRTEAQLVLLRHGQTDWSLSGRHTGTTDVPLTELGEKLATSLGAELADLGLHNPLVLTSPRIRAVRTAELAGLVIDRTWGDLVEWDYGDYEGLTTSQIRQTVPNWTVWTHPCPGGESHEAVQARADTVLSVLRPQLIDRDVVLVGHGHFSRALIARWLELPIVEGRRFVLSAPAYSALGVEHDTAALRCHNRHPAMID